MHENDLRNELAGRLEMLEPGLQLVATNYPLPNAHGTRGFVDILAHDRHRATVVIEIKRSNSTAREALHEVTIIVDIGVVGTQEAGSPEVFARLVTRPLWRRGRLRRSGIFMRQQQIRTDEELLAELAGWAGLSQVSFASSASPAVPSHWQSLLQRLQRCLAGNDVWSRVLPAWLAEVAEGLPDSDVRIVVFNPCDLLGGLIGGWPDRLDHLLPQLTAKVTVQGRLCRSLHGMLSWDGQPRPDPAGLIRLIYPDALAWSSTRAFGETWQTDRNLLALLEFDYLTFEVNGDGFPRRLKPSRAGIKRVPAILSNGDFYWPSHRPIQGFFRAHFAEIDMLMRQYREIM